MPHISAIPPGQICVWPGKGEGPWQCSLCGWAVQDGGGGAGQEKEESLSLLGGKIFCLKAFFLI